METAIIERHRRRESPVEEALIEMYLAGISVRRVIWLTPKPIAIIDEHDFDAPILSVLIDHWALNRTASEAALLAAVVLNFTAQR